MSALAQHVKLYGSVDETTLHLVAFPPGMTTKPHDSARVKEELAPAYGLRYAALPPPRKWCLISEGPTEAARAEAAREADLLDATPDRRRLHPAHCLIFAQVFPDPHSKQTATIMRPFLVKVVEGGDVYNQGK